MNAKNAKNIQQSKIAEQVQSHALLILFNSPPPRESSQHWFRWRLVACSAPSHYLNQRSLIINWTHKSKFQWYSNQNTKLFIYENAFRNIVCEMAFILSRWDELTPIMTNRVSDNQRLYFEIWTTERNMGTPRCGLPIWKTLILG